MAIHKSNVCFQKQHVNSLDILQPTFVYFYTCGIPEVIEVGIGLKNVLIKYQLFVYPIAM